VHGLFGKGAFDLIGHEARAPWAIKSDDANLLGLNTKNELWIEWR